MAAPMSETAPGRTLGGAAGSGAARVAVIVPAKDEQERIVDTVLAVRRVGGVDQVVVVDDGSRDATADRARAAGAVVVRHATNRGKAAALVSGVDEVIRRDRSHPDGEQPGRLLLFADADLAASAVELGVLIPPVASGAADLAIAVLPAQQTPGGGHGFVVGLARGGSVRLAGWSPQQPLSGMRCLTIEAFRAALPLAGGWGVETAMSIDLLAAGFGIVEVPCSLQHRVSGRGLAGQLHRAHQYADVWRALALRTPPLSRFLRLARFAR